MEVFDNLRSGILKDRSQFYKDIAIPLFGANRQGQGLTGYSGSVLALEHAGRPQECL